MVVELAKRIDAGVHQKTDVAKDRVVRRFVASNGLVHRVNTRQSQESAALMQSCFPDEVCSGQQDHDVNTAEFVAASN
jgi:hypothetical protein